MAGGRWSVRDPIQYGNNQLLEFPKKFVPGDPLEQAYENSGTLSNKKVFIGDSQIVLAGKGLFVAQDILKDEIITKFVGSVIGPGEDMLHPSHTITLEHDPASVVPEACNLEP